MKRLLFALLFVAGVLFTLAHPPRVLAVCGTGSSCEYYAISCTEVGRCAGIGTCGIGNKCCRTCPTPTPPPSCGGAYEGCCNSTPRCNTGYYCNGFVGECYPNAATPTPTPTPPPTQCSCSPPSFTDYSAYCASRPTCSTGSCFAVCNYSLTPCSWACTGDSATCTQALCTSWGSWYCNIDGTETQYCMAPTSNPDCTGVANARTPCQGNGGGPTPTQPPGCTPDCSGSGSYCSGASYYDPNGCTCTGTKDCTTCTVQGYKVLMPGNQRTNYPPAGDPTDITDSQPVYQNGTNPVTNNSYSFSQTSSLTYSVPNIAGYTTGYTLCYHDTGCHTGAISPGNSVSVDYPSCMSDPTWHYADLWWHYTPICVPDCSGAGSVCSGTPYNAPNCGSCTGTKVSPTTPPSNLSPSLTCPNPPNNTVFRTYSWGAMPEAIGYQFQLYVTDAGGTDYWCVNDGSVGTNSYTVSSCANSANTKTGTVTWKVLAHYDSCSGDSAFATKTYSVDKTAPPVPTGLTATCDVYGKVSASWNAATDIGCADSVEYWAQVSKDSTFATAYSDTSWANGWASGISRSTNEGAFSPGTVYLHVASRDGYDQQSLFSSPPISIPCPIPVGTIQARAVAVDPLLTSCTTIRAGGSGSIPGTTRFQFTPSSATYPVDPQYQSGSSYSYVVFNNLITGDYGIDPSPPPGYVLARTCWADAPGSTTGETSYATLGTLHTLTWDIGYTRGVPWVQAQGGDVYASGTLKSFVPKPRPPQVFISDGTTGGYPGVATYGTDCNFDSSSAVCAGKTWVSSKNWLVNDKGPATDFYDLMYRQFGSPTEESTLNKNSLTKPASGVYYLRGPVATNFTTPWNVNAGESIVIFVDNSAGLTDASLTINNTINIASGGFAAFIVNGNITVDPTVGVAYTSSAPVVEGVYITAPLKSFITGTGSGPATARFVGKGMFIAGDFALGRNVGDSGNTTTASELFIYNPQLLMTMPEAMKKLSVSWQEVAP